MAKTILGSVGKGGRNRFEDVVVVQYLLNCVPAKKGGPEKELVLDGLCGPLTTGAITRYQSTNFGFADGRVDAGGKTFHSLNAYDPYPNQNLNLPATGGQTGDKWHSGKKWTGKKGGTPSANAYDPWGYYNPAGENYMKDSKVPPSKMGQNSHEGIKGYGKQGVAGHEGIKQTWSGDKQGGASYGGIKGYGKQGVAGHEGIKQTWSGDKQGGASYGGIKGYGKQGVAGHEGIKQTGAAGKQSGKEAGGVWWQQVTDLLQGFGQKDGGMPEQPESVKGYGKGGGGIVGKF